MACLNKLAIRGIRSFDDKQMSVIEFFTPVTVIVGHNGSGKTTIIECLKYATTGDQPPNTRGGAFVHDPKMANEKEVKAQVKLRFHAANGARMLAVRNLSVTVKKTGLTMKTLESILALADGNIDNVGKRGVISTKCAEMDSEIPQLLGVSKSVLENVIFCHQEDSYWPLAEPSALKKKFDDIFEATRYTKALDSIKSLRKDRVAELKAEKERLESLSREKGHADKLKKRITELCNSMTQKKLEREKSKKDYDEVAEANRQLEIHAIRFREIFINIENLEAQERRLVEEIQEVKKNLSEEDGTDEELKSRLENYSEHLEGRKQLKKTEQSRKEELEDKKIYIQKAHTELSNSKGRLENAAEAQKQRIAERDELIRNMSNAHNIKGFSHPPFESEKIVTFTNRLDDLKRKQKAEYDELEAEKEAKVLEYNAKSRELSATVEQHKATKNSLREQIVERKNDILKGEQDLEQTVTLQTDLATLDDDLEEKQARKKKVEDEVKAAKYDERISAITAKIQTVENHRETLNQEIRSLNGQVDSRAKLDLKKDQMKASKNEVKHIMEIANSKLRRLIGRQADEETIEAEVDKLIRTKEREMTLAESSMNAANSALQQTEASLSSQQVLLNSKKQELKSSQRLFKEELGDFTNLDEALVDAEKEVDLRRNIISTVSGSGKVFESLLKTGKQKKLCTACNRHMNDQELVYFEKYLLEQMKKSEPAVVKHNKEELAEWNEELERFQKLRPVDSDISRLQSEIPAVEGKIREYNSLVESASKEVEKATEQLDKLKREVKDAQNLKEHSATVSRLRRELLGLKDDIQSLERDLSSTGSTRTVGDAEKELDTLTQSIRSSDKEKMNIGRESERQKTNIHSLEKDLHDLEIRRMTIQSHIKERTSLEGRIITWKSDIGSMTGRLKELDTLLAMAAEPLKLLEEEHSTSMHELTGKIFEAQSRVQELNKDFDRLGLAGKSIHQYVTQKMEERLDTCLERIAQYDEQLQLLSKQIEDSWSIINKIDQEIGRSGADISNLRDNIRIRRLTIELEETRQNISEAPLEEAHKARRIYETEFDKGKANEDKLNTIVSRLTGELSSQESQLSTWEGDLKEYKDIYKKYTEQLIKVKMSDMANSDLEKYAKALENAIMKYHTLKMEEVNDTMRHLWNKTYQGTDIDGIKIRSDVEGGVSKRSYNYRVVMTKDQVEMDMRGRCSAGQKMLASIIIRLALSDSFGQNCGILALDEPTNALDTENIDALADSLVDIINERKSHSNFQLIIITHDESFLRRLGQSDVMEYYWRVSRDSRQKSVIERQRVR